MMPLNPALIEKIAEESKKKGQFDLGIRGRKEPEKTEAPTGILDVLSAILDISMSSTERRK